MSDIQHDNLQLGDLVLTCDGYLGIVVGQRDVFLGNGCQAVLSDDEFAALTPLPINTYRSQGMPTANFLELLECRTTAQARRNQELGLLRADFIRTPWTW